MKNIRNIFSKVPLALVALSTASYAYDKTARILAIDGGGIRGLYAAYLLQAIEERTQKPLSSVFDVIAGTSTGGILALGLTTPNDTGKPKFSARDLIKLYETQGDKIFYSSIARQITTLGGLGQNKYSSDGLNKLLHEYFGNTTLSQSLTNVMVTSYNIEEARPYFFRSDQAKEDLSADHYLVQAARATSAAPTYFSPAHFSARDGKQYTLVDGGIIANNPSLDALLLAKLLYPEAKDYFLVSIGTGDLRKGLAYDQIGKQGELGWLAEIVNVMMDGNSILNDERMQALLNGPMQRYYRLQWPFPPENGAMDNVSEDNIKAIKRIAQDAKRFFNRDLDEISQKLRAFYTLEQAASNATLSATPTQVPLTFKTFENAPKRQLSVAAHRSTLKDQVIEDQEL